MIVGSIDETQRLFGLEASGIVLLRDEQRKEHGVQAPFFRTDQVELSVVHTLSHVAAVIELTVDHMNVGIEDESVIVEFPGAVGQLSRPRQGQERQQHHESVHQNVSSNPLYYQA